MELSNSFDFLKTMEEDRWCGTTYLAIYERPTETEWEPSVFEYLPMYDDSLETLKKSLIEVKDSTLARNILTILLHQDLVYSAKIMSIKKAVSFAKKFCSLFSNQAIYYSNSTWNKNEYMGSAKIFEFGLSAWTPLTEATFDSGIIICDSDKIGIAWFADED